MTFEEYAKAHDLYFTEDYESDEFQIAREAWDSRVPEGYVLVPLIPTEKMIADGISERVSGTPSREVISTYAAMVQAAQEEE